MPAQPTTSEEFKPALSAQGRSLCIDNLPPGSNFDLALKKGMRSKLGLELAADISAIPIGGPDMPSRRFGSRAAGSSFLGQGPERSKFGRLT